MLPGFIIAIWINKEVIETIGPDKDIEYLNYKEEYAYVSADFSPSLEEADWDPKEANEESKHYHKFKAPSSVMDDRGASVSWQNGNQYQYMEYEQCKCHP